MPFHTRFALLAAAAILAAAPRAASADDVATVRAKVAAAMQAAHSYVATTTAASQSGNFSVTTTYVAPDRYHSALSFNGTSYDVVLVGSTGYLSANGNPYSRVPAPPSVLAVQAQLRDVPVDAVLPDATENGVVVGRFSTNTAGPQHTDSLTCSYDKRTYRISSCTGARLTIAFGRYDDPANAVTIPTRLAAPAPASTP